MNQFSESLLTIPHADFDGWSWCDLHSMSAKLVFAFAGLSPNNVSADEWKEEKCTFLCFIIAMSDQDLFECFGIPLPAGLSTKYI